MRKTRKVNIVIILVGVLASWVVPASVQKVPPPDERGGFNVGTTAFTATMTGGR